MWTATSESVSIGIRTRLARLRRVAGEERGQSMVEYAILGALIAIVSMATVKAMGSGVSQVFQNILSKIQGI